MKIDIVTSFFYPVEGGAENHVLYISKELEKLDHRVTIHTSNIDRENNKLNSQEIVRGLNVKRYKVWFKIGEFASFFPGVYKAVKKSDSDIVHVHVYRNPHNLIPFFTKKPCVLTLHWPEYPKGLRSRFNDFVIPIFDILIGKILLKKFKILIALNDLEKEWIIDKFGIKAEKIKIIPNGIPKDYLRIRDRDIFRKKHGLKGLIVLYFGRIHQSKGIDQLINNAKFFPEVNFIIMGNGPELKELQVLALSLNNIHFISGEITDEEKLQAMSAADIFVYPSHYDAFGIAVLEAFSQKCAVITSNQGGLPWVVDKAGLTFEDNNLEDLKNKLHKLIKNKKLRLKLQKEGYERAKKFTWEKIVKNIEYAYKEALK